ncbi:hypothetical protein ACWFNE_16030 [Cellulomonas sp. NPDC055163]
MPPTPFVSRSPHAEDLILAYALGLVPRPRFVEVPATAQSPTRCAALLDLGWSGSSLPADELAGPAATSAWPGDGDVHALLVDAGAVEADALTVLDVAAHRPWVVVAASEVPGAGPAVEALTAAGYEVVLHDGASTYLVDPARAARVRLPIATEPGATPDAAPAEVVTTDVVATPVTGAGRDAAAPDAPPAEGQDALAARLAALEAQHDEALRQLVRWRARALDSWSTAASEHGGPDQDSLRRELEALRSTLSWRVTRPLRAARTVAARLRGRA